QVCSNARCPRANSFSPLEWSKWALQGTRIQCVVCHKLRVPRHQSVFCNVTCFKEAWKDHQKVHAIAEGESSIRKVSHNFSLSPKKVFFVGDSVEELAQDENKGEEAEDVPVDALVVDEEEEWLPISTEGRYTPTDADVGHSIRLEVRAMLPNGSQVCTPKVITTEPVLSSEKIL
ncbi:unnamed protein product, partial [Choristocarpus tenellus]